GRIADQEIDRKKNDDDDRNCFPLQIWIHDWRVKREVRAQEVLIGIFRCLHLRNRGTRDAYFYLIGDFENDGITVNSVYNAVNAAGSDDLVAALKGLQHSLRFLALPLLRQDEHHVKDAHHDNHHRQRIAENRRSATRYLH